jgi:hypothetical protein
MIEHLQHRLLFPKRAEQQWKAPTLVARAYQSQKGLPKCDKNLPKTSVTKPTKGTIAYPIGKNLPKCDENLPRRHESAQVARVNTSVTRT